MARGPNQLTVNQVRNAKPGPDGKQLLLCDGANLWLSVGRTKDGRITKSWIFRYAMPGTGRERHMGLGPLHTVGCVRNACGPALFRRSSENPRFTSGGSEGLPAMEGLGSKVRQGLVLAWGPFPRHTAQKFGAGAMAIVMNGITFDRNGGAIVYLIDTETGLQPLLPTPSPPPDPNLPAGEED